MITADDFLIAVVLVWGFVGLIVLWDYLKRK